MTGNHGTAQLDTQANDDLRPYWKLKPKLFLNAFSEEDETIDEEALGGYDYPPGVPGFILGENEWLHEGGLKGDRGVVWSPAERPGMALTVGGSRKGKGASTLIPALLGYSGSCIAIDIKGELAWITAKRRRQMGQRVVILDPFDQVNSEFGELVGDRETVTHYNPLADLDPQARSFAEDIAGVVEALLWQSDHADPFFVSSARELVTGLIAAVVQEDPGFGSLPDVRDWLNLPEDDLAARCQQFCERETSKNTLAQRKLLAFSKLNKSYSGVIATCKEQLGFLDSDEMRSFLRTDKSTFHFSELTSASPTTVYIVLPGIHLETHSRFLRLCISQGIRNVMRKRPEKLTLPVVFFLDEMGTSLGPMPVIQKAWGLASGYGLVLWGFIQNLGQLKADYPKDWETFIANSAMFQMIACRDQETSKYFSEYLGNTTVATISHNHSHSTNQSWTTGTSSGTSSSSGSSSSRGGSGWSESTSASQGTTKGSSDSKTYGSSNTSGTTIGEMGRPLLDPEQIRTLPENRTIIIFPGEIPYNVTRLVYFRDSRFYGMYRPDPHYPPPNPRYINPPKVRNPLIVAEEEAEAQRKALAEWEAGEPARRQERQRLLDEQKALERAARYRAEMAEQERLRLEAHRRKIELLKGFIPRFGVAIPAGGVWGWWSWAMSAHGLHSDGMAYIYMILTGIFCFGFRAKEPRIALCVGSFLWGCYCYNFGGYA